MVEKFPVYSDQAITGLKVFACLVFFLLLPSTSEAALAILFLLPFVTLATLASAWIFGRSGMILATVVSVLVVATTAFKLLSFL